MSKKIFLLLLFFAFISASAQDSMPSKPVVCYGGEGTTLTEILPENILQNATKRIATNPLTFSITYDSNFPAAAKIAFEKAANIWSSYLTSSVTVHIKASWQVLTGSTLAQTGATKIYRNFTGVPYKNVWYVVPLAEAISGTELNSGEDDITVNLNSQFNWNYATDGKAVAGKYDLVSVVLHELAHGLGISSSLTLNTSNSAQGQWGQVTGNINSATIYDVFIQDAQNRLLTNTGIYTNPSTDLKTAMTSNALYFGLKNENFKNSLPKLYAPNPYVEGTSISHLDETAYPAGSANSLMSPQVRAGEVVQTPGTLLLNMLYEMGWYIPVVAATITGNEEEILRTYEPKIFPNPSADLVYIAIPDNGKIRDVTIELLNQQGSILSTLQKKNIGAETVEISINNLPAGIYFLRISGENQVVMKKIMKD